MEDREVARHWDANADLWADQVRRGCDVYREYFNNPAFFAFVGDVAGKDVLDAGCGEGYNTRRFARLGGRMVGVDVSIRMIELACQQESREHLGIRYEVGSFSELTFLAESSFDMVVSTMALMDSARFSDAARELFRVLRPGGELAFSVSHPCFMTPGLRWLKDDRGTEAKLIVSGYFDEAPRIGAWKFKEAPEGVPQFHIPVFNHKLSDYLNGLIRAGFVLGEIQEPRPTEEASREHPWLRRWRDHAAIFLYIRGKKPSQP